MAKAYVKFEVSKEVADKIVEAIRLAKQSGAVKKGANEVTKSIERGLASFVVIAEDVEPEEVVMHIPMLCEQKKITFAYLPTKEILGKAAGLNVPCTAVAVEKMGQAEGAIKEIASRITGKPQEKAEPKEKAEQKPQPKPKADAQGKQQQKN
ncbi:MAG: 50S ribosomal protein L7Ae [Candidatus Micrarchaeia archaeon]